MAEDNKISDDEILSAFKGEQPTVSQPVYRKEEAKGISDEAMLAAFKGTDPGMQTSGGTLSGGGQMFRPEMVGSTAPVEQSSLVGSGALGSGQFAPIPVGPKGKFEEYAGITDPNTRKGIAETVFKGITDPHDLEELHDKVPWYNIAENPVQMESFFQYKWNKKADPFELAADAAKAGVGMLESLPPLVAGAGRLAKDALAGAVYVGDPSAFGKGRTLTDEEKKGMTPQEIQDAELSLRDKTFRSARVFGDAALEAEEQLRKAATNFVEGKSMLYDKARVAFANAGDYGDFSGFQATPETIQEAEARKAAKTAELMADARKNFATRLNAKHVEHLQKEKNPAVLAREISAVWQYPAVKSFATDVIENLMPPAEDAAPSFGGDIEAAKAARRAHAAEAAEVGVQSAITEANRLREDPEQVGAVAMTTPVNVVGAGGMILGGLGRVNQALVRGLKALGKTDQEINAMFSAERAAVQAQREAAAIAREQPGKLESALGSMADTADKIPGALAKIPQPVQYIGSALAGAGAGAIMSDDPLWGALKGATTGAGIKLGGKAILAAPRLGEELLKAGRLSGAELGRFEALEKMGSASPAVQKFVNWSQKAGGGKALDFIEKNANTFVQHNVSMLPMMVALGVLEDKDAKEFSQMWAEFATYGFLHGQVLGGMLGNDPVRMKMNRDAEMRQAQRVMQASSPETRDNLRNLNWDRVVEHSEARLERTKAEYAKQLEIDPDSPEAAQAKSDYDFAHQLHRQNLIAPPETRAAFEDGIKLSLAKASNLINGVLTPNSNMNVELLTTPQIYKKMIDANPNYNGVGAPLTMEQAMAMNPGADGVKIGKGISKDGFTMDAAKDTVFVNLDNAMNKARLTGEAIPNVLAHEVVGHGLFGKEEYRQKIAPLYNQMFGTEVMDENGNWREVTPAQPGLSREDLFEKFFTKYLAGKTPESVAQYAEAAGVWDKANNTFDKNKVVDLMREEVLAEAHAGRFFSDPESPAQRGISWLASRISGNNLKSALNHLYSVAGPAVYKQWTSGATGATYSPEVMRAIRNVEREMQKYDGEFVDAEQGEAVAAPITKKDVIKSREMLQKYYGDTGKFETTPVAVVTDKNGKVVQTIDLKDKEAFEGSWNYHQDEATGDNVPNKEKGFGELPPELAGVEVPVGGRVQVQRQIAYDEATGKPLERKNKETVEALKRRVQLLREAIDNAGDPSQLGRFRAIKGGQGKDDEDLHYTGKMTLEQRAAIAALPESVVPASMKELLFKYDDLMTRGDGTVLDIDYASRLNDKGNYQAFSPKIRQIVPLQLHLSKAGNFYTTAWDISDLRRKVKLYEKYAKGVFEPWGGDTQKFWNEFRTILLPNLANPDANVPGWQGLDADPNVAKLKRTIYEKMLGAPNPNVPDVESIPDLPREKFSRSERKLDKQSSFDKIIKSFRLDSHTAAEENANSEYKYPIPYKARFMPEQEQAEEQRLALGGGILKGLQAVSAKYTPESTGEVKATVQPAEAQVRFMPEREEDLTMVAPGFYSKAGRVLLDKMPNRASAEQIRAILDPQKGSGVKPDELKWSGINQFIDATQAEKGYVTKDDVKQFLKDSYAAKFETQTMRQKSQSEFYTSAEPWGENVRYNTIKAAEEAAQRLFGLNEEEAAKLVWKTNEANSDPDYFTESADETKYSKYKLPGGTNYEETVLRMPGVDYVSEQHFPEVPNYVAHMRTQDFGDGRLIEELQSDLHQKGREKGYKDEQIRAYNRVREIESKGQSATPEERKEWADLMNAGAMRQEGVADAPFRKDWPLQLFKHALQKAVADGKKWIGWTGGEAQADRYDLRQLVDKVNYDPFNERLVGIKDRTRVFDESGIPKEKLADYIGKEAASKLLQPETLNGAGNHELSGSDLSVGGEGMKGFYDVMLPKEIGKYVKQWGAKVEPSEVEGKKEYVIQGNPNISSTMTFNNRSHAVVALNNRGRGEGGEVVEIGENPKIWKVQITPEMSQSVAGGQARFLPTRLDAEHAAAHEAKDEEKAQKLVRKAAERVGGRQVKYTAIISPQGIIPRNEITNQSQFNINVLNFKKNGWIGRPLLVAETFNGDEAITGSHRLLAAQAAGLKKIPVVKIDLEEYQKWLDENPSNIVVDIDGFLNNTREEDQLSALQEAKEEGFKANWLQQAIDLLKIEDESNWQSDRKSSLSDSPFIVGNSVKSADPFTYDNEGKLIPLSERFNAGTGDIRFMPNVAVVPERFTGTAEEERRGKYVAPPKFFNKFNISQYEKGGKFFDAETGEDLTDKSYENASIAVVNGKPSLVANNEAETTGTGPLFKTNLFKQKAGWKWVSKDAPDTSTIVSVEGQGKHFYALQADFQNGVTMARYPDKASEPRLRPTGRGELTMGEQIGTIDIRGKQHPVYDKVTIGQAPKSAQIRFMPDQSVDEQTQQTRINEPGRERKNIGVRSDEAGDRGGQRTARGYSPLPGAPNVFGRSGPIAKISNIADRYAESRGIPIRKQAAYTEADVERGRRIAEEYAKMPHDPQNPRVQEAYADLIRQSADQYKALVENGYKAWFVDPANDPYEGKPWRAMRDLRENESMGVFPTDAGFGSGDTDLNVADNPLLGDSGLKWPYGSPDGPLRRVLWNDVFRYIHDAFGHGIEGAGFRADGEENAWQAHVRLFDGPAVAAMTTETRGQNSWLNFGPHAEKNKTASVEDTVFADQKTGLMPEWTWREGVVPDEPLLESGALSNIRFLPSANKKKPAKQKKVAAEEEKLSPQEKAAIKLRTAFVVDEGDSVSLPILQETANGKPKLDKNKEPKIIKLDYNLVDSPEITQFFGGVVEDPTKPDWENLPYDVPVKFQKIINAAIDSGAIDDAANRAVDKTAKYLQNPEIAAGKGWYSRMRDNLLEALGEEKRELLSQLLGATSAKTPVNENFLQAMDALEGIISGRYDSNREAYLAMLAFEEKGELNTLIKEKNYVATIESKIKQLKKEAKKLTGKKQQEAKTKIAKLQDLIAIPEEERTKKDRMKITVLGSGLMPLRSNGKKFNANSMAVMKVIAGTWLDNRSAPKTPNFAGNLSGRTVQATIDVWAARFLRQLLYENSGKPWRIQPKSETGVSNEDFALGQIIMERAAKKLDMNPDDLQAVLWFAEKDNWEKQGWTKNVGAEKSSFDEIFHKFFPKGKKPLSFQEAIELFAKEKAKIND